MSSGIRERFLRTAAALVLSVCAGDTALVSAHESDGHGLVIESESVPDAAAVTAEPPPAPTSPSDDKPVTGPKPDDVFFEAYWDEGVRYRLLGNIKLIEWEPGKPLLTREPLLIGSLGFKLHVDAAAYAQAQGLSGVDGGVEVRRSFLTADGIFFNEIWPVEFALEFGAITSSFFFSEGYVILRDLPYIRTFQFGQFTAPLSLDAIISSRDRSLMESAAPVAAFSLNKRLGSQFSEYLPEHEVTWAFGWFGDGQDQDFGDASESFARLVGRITWLAVDEPDAEQPTLVHVGLGLSYLFSSDGEVRYQSRPESFIAPIAVDTGTMDSKNAIVVGAEAAFSRGSLWGQFEYLHAGATGGDTDDVNFPGFYLSLGGILTGEVRPYQRERGRFSHIIPHKPLSYANGTWGAGEWATRYSFLSLNSNNVRGGEMHSFSTGYNWYWNRYIRWQFNYVYSDIDGGTLDGVLHTFQTRFQLVI